MCIRDRLDTGDNAKEKFLKKFDSDWKRYNRDLIREVQDYQKEQEEACLLYTSW